MILSRELGKRIWGGSSTNMENGGGGISSDYIAGLLTGYAKESWVDEHYISIDFFSRLFQAHGTENGSEIDVMPNDMDTTITSVESMFGFWTNLYISALGSNGAAPAGISLGMLTDVNITGTPSAGQVLTFDAVSGEWVNGNATGASSLATLTDVTLTSLQNGQTLLYDSTTSKWYNSALKTINGQSLLGSGDISVGGGASGNYLPLTGGTLTGALTVNANQSGWLTTITNNDTGVWLANNQGYGMAVETKSTSAAMYLFQCVYGETLLGQGGTTAFRIMCNGCVGINTNVPSAKLHVDGEIKIDNGSIHLTKGVGGFFSSDTVGAYMQSGTSNWIYVKPSSPIELHGDTDASGRLYVGESGVIGIYIGADYLGNKSRGYDCIERAGSGNALHLHYFNSGNVSICNGGGRVGIGIASPSYMLHVNGTVYATGSITALSDARKKDITGEAGVTVEQIAHAPAVQFLWKDKEKRKDGQQVGTLAQYWQTVMPEVVMDKGGELSMQYGVAALVSAIVTARKVVDHERRIAELEKEVEQLRLN